MVKELKLGFLAVGTMLTAAPMMAVVLFSSDAFANQCAAQCYAQENACRRATNDDPKCSAELTKCLQSCRGQN